MFKRFLTVIKSFFNFLIGKTENPELILDQMLEDMKGKLVQMRNNAVGVIAAEKQLMQRIEASQQKIADLDNEIRLAVKAGKDDLASSLIGMKNNEQTTLKELQSQHAKSHEASEQAKQMIKDYELQMQKALNEKIQLTGANKQALMQEQLAKTMQSFSVSDEFGTLERMREKIKERQARGEAMLELGKSQVQSRLSSVQQNAAAVETQAQLLEYKKQLGLLPASSEETETKPQKTMEPLKLEEKPPGG